MEAGAEVDDEIEVAVGEGKAAYIGHDQLGASSSFVQSPACVSQQRRIDVDADQTSWCEVSSQCWKGDTSPTADLQDSGAAWEPQSPEHQGNFDVLLAPVTAMLVGEGAVF